MEVLGRRAGPKCRVHEGTMLCEEGDPVQWPRRM